MKYLRLVMITTLLIAVACGPVYAQKKKDAGNQQNNQAQMKKKAMSEIIEEIYVGKEFSYDPENRRDPFASLTVVGQSIDKKNRPRQGIESCLVQELELMGVMDTPEGLRAMVIACDNKGYWLKRGDQLYDGEVLDINFDERCVTFRQEVNDPLAIKPFTDISKCLSPVEEKGK